MPCLKIALPTNLHPWMNLFALRLKGVEIKTIIIWVLRDSEHPTTVLYDKLFEQLARNLSALSCIMHTSLTLSPLARDRNHTGYLCVLRAPHITDTHTHKPSCWALYESHMHTLCMGIIHAHSIPGADDTSSIKMTETALHIKCNQNLFPAVFAHSVSYYNTFI